MDAAKTGDDRQMSGFPDVALPVPPSKDSERDRIPGTRGVAPDDLVPPDPVHRRVPR